MGGSSASNAMIYIRGHAQNYDDWAALGNKGWGYAQMFPFFKRSENQQRAADTFHGTSGPLHVQDINLKNKLCRVFVEAAKEAGHAENLDFNAGEQEGVGFFQLTQKDGRRCSTAAAYLREAELLDNLTVISSAHVTQLNFDTANKRIVGLSYDWQAQIIEMKAKREVIVCGGAINSPQLLMLSGIGEWAELEKHGITVKHELPGVGKNLQDPLDIMLVQKSLKAESYGLGLKNLFTHLPYNLYQYMIKKTRLFCLQR